MLYKRRRKKNDKDENEEHNRLSTTLFSSHNRNYRMPGEGPVGGQWNSTKWMKELEGKSSWDGQAIKPFKRHPSNKRPLSKNVCTTETALREKAKWRGSSEDQGPYFVATLNIEQAHANGTPTGTQKENVYHPWFCSMQAANHCTNQ